MNLTQVWMIPGKIACQGVSLVVESLSLMADLRTLRIRDVTVMSTIVKLPMCDTHTQTHTQGHTQGGSSDVSTISAWWPHVATPSFSYSIRYLSAIFAMPGRWSIGAVQAHAGPKGSKLGSRRYEGLETRNRQQQSITTVQQADVSLWSYNHLW